MASRRWIGAILAKWLQSGGGGGGGGAGGVFQGPLRLSAALMPQELKAELVNYALYGMRKRAQ
eukprot:12925964-Prorocentrum_lima.AAC.1